MTERESQCSSHSVLPFSGEYHYRLLTDHVTPLHLGFLVYKMQMLTALYFTLVMIVVLLLLHISSASHC